MANWASPLVFPEPLSRLARAAQKSLGGATVEAIANAYASEGWRCDAAAVEAMAHTISGAVTALVRNVLKAVYKPWMEESARHFQTVASKNPEELRNAALGVMPQAETCIVFADGLRFDVAAVYRNCWRLGYRAVYPIAWRRYLRSPPQPSPLPRLRICSVRRPLTTESSRPRWARATNRRTRNG